ncbi:hypothetical protein B0H16DRAFT_1468414 [Mycena metata]|uniref:Uncharacterized protein n=1 Tax=Mycena metata TaxID=1033252 RepID=A0AAD7I0T3_9AGAR|nr:hypothetical protein B0H16DRAFT_1468414 [Mycena metata]
MSPALQHSQIALSLAQKNANYKRQSLALMRLSYIKWLVGDYTTSRAYAQAGQKVAKISGDLYREANGVYYEALCWQAWGITKNAFLSVPEGELSLTGVIHNGILQEAVNDPYRQGFALISIAEIQVLAGAPVNVIQKKLDTSKAIAKAGGYPTVEIACEATQADLNLREGRGKLTEVAKRVQDIDERLGGIGETVKAQHSRNLAQCVERDAPMGTGDGGIRIYLKMSWSGKWAASGSQFGPNPVTIGEVKAEN